MQYLPRLIHDIHEKKLHFGLPKKNAVLRKYYAEKKSGSKDGYFRDRLCVLNRLK